MKTISITELKAALSEYLARVKTGEEVLVTDRGVPVAKLVSVFLDQNCELTLGALSRSGLVRLPSTKATLDFSKRKKIKDPKGSILKNFLKERKSGW